MPRIIVRIDTTEKTKQSIDSLCDRYGLLHVAVASQLIQWFTTQPDVIQALIMRNYPGDTDGANVAKLALQQMAEAGKWIAD